MAPDEEGFLFPVLNETKCISCGLCGKICPAVQQESISSISRTADHVFAAWRTDTGKRMDSTSGGIFAALAERFMEQENSIVYGAAYQKADSVRHIRVESKDQLNRLLGSKYVQSNMEDVYIQIKKDLKDGKKVLFSGTPCQVMAVRLFCQDQRENLLTVDLICHGVPSPLIFQKYIEDLGNRKHGKITEFKFRTKKKSGYRAYIDYTVDGKKKYQVLAGLEPYMRGFYKGYFNRESCYNCPFVSPARISDITLGDYWGFRKLYHKYSFEEKYGVSVILCNTEKGEKYFNQIHDIKTIPSTLKNAAAYNVRLRNHEPRPAFRDQSYKILKEHGFSYLRTNFLRNRFYYIHMITPSFIKNILRIVFK